MYLLLRASDEKLRWQQALRPKVRVGDARQQRLSMMTVSAGHRPHHLSGFVTGARGGSKHLQACRLTAIGAGTTQNVRPLGASVLNSPMATGP